MCSWVVDAMAFGAVAPNTRERVTARQSAVGAGPSPSPPAPPAAPSSLSEPDVTSVTSKSSVIRSAAAPFAQARSRARRRASRRTPSRSGVIDSMTRQAVGDDPHLAEQVGLPTQHAQVGQAIAAVRDAHNQVPHHPARIVSRAPARRVGAIPTDSAAVHPNRSARSVRATLPAWLAILAPSVVTMSVLRRLVGFTFDVLSLGWVRGRLSTPVSNSGDPFFYPSSHVAARPIEMSGLVLRCVVRHRNVHNVH